MRLQRGFALAVYSLVLASIVALGCRPTPDTGTPAPQAGGSHDEHDHDHDHDHAAGPHGGHLLELTASGAEKQYHAEWLHDDLNGVVAVYLLDGDEPLPQEGAPQTVTIATRSGKSPKTYELSAATTEEDPDHIVYAIEEPALVTALQVIVEGEEPTLSATIGEHTYEAKFEKHEHHHH